MLIQRLDLGRLEPLPTKDIALCLSTGVLVAALDCTKLWNLCENGLQSVGRAIDIGRANSIAKPKDIGLVGVFHSILQFRAWTSRQGALWHEPL